MAYTKDKFIVVNTKYLDYLSNTEREQLQNIWDKLPDAVKEKEYIVVNRDEPYADQVWKLIEENETKEIVAFMGRAGSGKDYQSVLLERQGYHKMAFADALRKIAFNIIGLSYEEGMKQYDWLKSNEIINGLNFRQILERLGTEGIRSYDNDFWANCLVTDIARNKYKKVVVSDLRFPNEFKALATFAKLNGYDFKCYFCDYHSDRYQTDNAHASAKMANWFAARCNDLSQIYISDIIEYEESLED